MKKNKHIKALRVWTYVFAGLLVFLITVSLVLTQVDFLYYTICSAVGGSERVLKKGNPDDYVYYESSYENKSEVLAAANALNERIVEEGIVLLKNEDNALPLKTEKKLTVFGKNSVDLIIGGFRFHSRACGAGEGDFFPERGRKSRFSRLSHFRGLYRQPQTSRLL